MISMPTPAPSCFIVDYERMSRHHTCVGLLELCNDDQSVLGRVNLSGLARVHHSIIKMNENLPILKDLTAYGRYPTGIR